jgi:hypothetical protein
MVCVTAQPNIQFWPNNPQVLTAILTAIFAAISGCRTIGFRSGIGLSSPELTFRAQASPSKILYWNHIYCMVIRISERFVKSVVFGTMINLIISHPKKKQDNLNNFKYLQTSHTLEANAKIAAFICVRAMRASLQLTLW